MHLPAGCVLAERSLWNAFVCGVRRTCLPHGAGAGKSIQFLQMLRGMMPPCDTKDHALSLPAPGVPTGGTVTPGAPAGEESGEEAAVPLAAVEAEGKEKAKKQE